MLQQGGAGRAAVVAAMLARRGAHARGAQVRCGGGHDGQAKPKQREVLTQGWWRRLLHHDEGLLLGFRQDQRHLHALTQSQQSPKGGWGGKNHPRKWGQGKGLKNNRGEIKMKGGNITELQLCYKAAMGRSQAHCFSEKWSEEVCRMEDCRSALMPVPVASVPVASARPRSAARPAPLAPVGSPCPAPDQALTDPKRPPVYIISSARRRDEITARSGSTSHKPWRGSARRGWPAASRSSEGSWRLHCSPLTDSHRPAERPAPLRPAPLHAARPRSPRHGATHHPSPTRRNEPASPLSPSHPRDKPGRGLSRTPAPRLHAQAHRDAAVAARTGRRRQHRQQSLLVLLQRGCGSVVQQARSQGVAAWSVRPLACVAAQRRVA